MSKCPILAIVGPTGVGKTDLSLSISSEFPVEIVNVDSRQIYRGMDIGTAKPTSAQRAIVTHHLIDVASPNDEFNLNKYLSLAHCAIEEVYKRGRIPLLVGGTGQYFWALLEAWQVPSIPPDRKLRDELEELVKREGVDFLFKRLLKVDVGSESLIDPRNIRRVIRALEIYHQTGIPASKLRKRGDSVFDACIIGLTLPRMELYSRIDQRVDRMIERGWEGEVRALLDSGVSHTSPAISSVGYAELMAYINKDLELNIAIQNTKYRTHRLARHQSSWFRVSDARIRWLQAGISTEEATRGIIREHLNA